MTEGELVEHLQLQVDEARAERLTLFALGLALVRLVSMLGRLVPDGEWDRLEDHDATAGRRALDQAVELLQTDRDRDGRIAGSDIAELRQLLQDLEQRTETGR